jgi:hypothetical protein
LKASLHDSGSWHIAYSKKFFEDSVAPVTPSRGDRFVEQWPRPRELASGLTLAFRIVTPANAVTAHRSKSEATGIVWIPNAPPGKAMEVDVVLTAPGVQTTGWPGRRSMGTSLVGSLPLQNGQTAWVVAWVVDMPDLSKINNGQISARFYRGRSYADIKAADSLRALVIGSEPDGSRVMYDCPVVQRANEQGSP